MQPSLTAQGVARARARMTRPASADGDPDGEERLNADLATGPPRAPTRMFHHLAARTRFFDDLTLGELAAGTRQVVIVGAGYDGRALRFRTPGVRFFELDRAPTQDDKRARLARLGVRADDITFVSIDLVDGDTGGALAAAGHDPAQPSLFICEGLLLYLDLAVIRRLFDELRRRVAATGTLSLSLGLRDPRGADPRAVAARAQFRRRLTRIGEPPRTRLDRAEWNALLRDTGWALASETDPHQLDADAPSGGSLLVTAIPAPA